MLCGTLREIRYGSNQPWPERECQVRLRAIAVLIDHYCSRRDGVPVRCLCSRRACTNCRDAWAACWLQYAADSASLHSEHHCLKFFRGRDVMTRLAGRVRRFAKISQGKVPGQEVFEISRVGSDQVDSDQVGSARFGSDRIGSGRIGSDRVCGFSTFSRVGSGQQVLISHGSGRPCDNRIRPVNKALIIFTGGSGRSGHSRITVSQCDI